MIEALVVITVLAAAAVALARRDASPRELRPSQLGDRLPPEFRLVRSSLGNGSGFVMERISDGQRLSWQRLNQDHPGLYAFDVAGENHYRNEIQRRDFAPGARVRLVPEPDNPYDADAVAVRSGNGRLKCGYVPREEAAKVKEMLEEQQPYTATVMWAANDERGSRCALRVLMVRRDVPVSLPKG